MGNINNVNNMDKVIIEGLECFGKHGVMPEENTLGQKFIVSCELYCDVSDCATLDFIDLAINYAEVSSFITAYVKNTMFKLIETLASRLADELLTKYDIKGIKIRIEKPFAPIGLSVNTVAVEVNRQWTTSYIGLGSNLGEKEKYLIDALNALRADNKIKVTKVSDFIKTAPYGVHDQPYFINSIAEIKTIYTPHQLLKVLNTIEQLANRTREIKWGPRTLDLDIILFGDLIINDDVLNIPHIDMENRAFVLEPLSKIAPYAFNRVLNKSAKQMYNELVASLTVTENPDTDVSTDYRRLIGLK